MPWVIDTNVGLDLLVFDDPSVQALHLALESGHVDWLVCAPMRDELQRVLSYPAIAKALARAGRKEPDVLANFDRLSRVVPIPALAAVRCGDPDDQPFVDLALAHGAILLSKDRELLALRSAMARLGVCVTDRFDRTT